MTKNSGISPIFIIIVVIAAIWIIRKILSWISKLKADKDFYNKNYKLVMNTFQTNKDLEKSLKEQTDQISTDRRRLIKLQNDFQILIKERTKGYPLLANAYSEYLTLQDKFAEEYLRNKPHPALKSAQIISELKKEKKKLIIENNTIKHTLAYYDSIVPWLSEAQEFDEHYNLSASIESQVTDEDDPAANWLSPQEYKGLTNAEKFQIALDRYKNRTKSKWELGRDFERYIGYSYENYGFSVEYKGILDGYEDLGRDLICQKDNKTEIIQCKYWSSRKEIHEKHINQLYGTCIMYAIQNYELTPGDIPRIDVLQEFNIKPVIITSTLLSQTARQFAETLGIDYEENVKMCDYPAIKCNISLGGEKIYHLPFDQQYDRTKIKTIGEFYAMTVAEAEEKGFRRAMKWLGQK